MTDNIRPKVIVIEGPTASGKTSLGVELALTLGGEIINADSMQVYRGMDIGTAKPTLEQQKGIPHHLLDVVKPDEEFNAAIYHSMARPLVIDVCARGKICLVVGGTGLYIKGLLGGFFKCPPADHVLRESLLEEYQHYGPERLHKRLMRLDTESASKIHPNDRTRIIRALEVVYLTDRRPSDLIREHGFGDSPLKALKFCLGLGREELYELINERCLEMVRAGLKEETKALLRKGYSPDLKAMKAIGYRHMIRHIDGEWSLTETIQNLQRDTRRYAKRQLTWFRADPDVIWIAPSDFKVVLRKIRDFITV